MLCPRCTTDNADDRRFCRGCGAPLPVPCPACGFGNAADDRFCGGCGRELGGTPARQATDRRPEADRRQVTILFADLCASTELTRRLDAEDMRDLVGKVFRVFDGAVEAHGGTVDKHMGDGVMALFGAPVAHDDDPLRAVRAAEAIHGGVAALAAETGLDLAAHVGIAAGEVVAGAVGEAGSDYTVIGESVNVAARLLGLAGAGETLFTAAVRDQVAHRFPTRPGPVAELRGFDQPIATWRPGGDALSEHRPFVGRRAELAQVERILEACQAEQRGQVVVLRGEAGIGKTRLVERIADEAAGRGLSPLRVEILDFGTGRGQDPARTLVRGLLDLDADADPGARVAALGAVAAREDFDHATRAHVDDLLDLPADPVRTAYFDALDVETRTQGRRDALAALLRTAAARVPRLIVIEDAHWADASTLGDMAALARTTAEIPAVLVATTRVEGDRFDHAWRAMIGATVSTTLDLGPLRPEDAHTLAHSTVEAPEGIVARCVERAEGNPLFLIQLLRHGIDAAEDEIPGSLQSLVLARMDRLAAADRRGLQAASVLGQKFRLEALRHLLDDGGYAPEPLVRQGLLRHDAHGYLFAHALIRDGVYGSLVKARRRELHERAAAWYGADDPVLYARHLAAARHPAAAQALLAAAEHEARAFRLDAALGLANTGIARATDDAMRHAIALVQGQILLDLGRAESARDAFKAGIEASDAGVRARALIGLAEASRLIDDHDGAFAALAEAEPLARTGGHLATLARIESLRGNLYFLLGRIADCRAAHQRALEAARAAGSAEDEARALGGLTDAAYAEGRLVTASRHLEDFLALCRAHGFARMEASYRPMYAIGLFSQLRLDDAEEQDRLALAAARHIGHKRAEMIGVHVAVMVAVYRGDARRARDQAEREIAITRELGTARFESEALQHRSMAEFGLGELDAARASIATALELARRSDMAFYGPVVLGWHARLAGDPGTKAAAHAEAEALLAGGSLSHNHFFYREVAIDDALATGDWDAAIRHADRLVAYVAAEPLALPCYTADRGRALALWGRGDRSPARRAELVRLRDLARTAGLAFGLAELEQALA